ncbi:PD-(D/E)XK motif protein [Pseudomonas sp. PSE1(2024)]|uniref:PD-(D/E)XK motif protein n=1 Tax=Pseudomonas sp. PSE1(2024) TaxID=3228746 RepID=UPI003D98231A
MPRSIEEFVAAWDALSGECGQEGGWLGIVVTSVGACELMAARRFPGNEEALLARFPTARLGAAERLPEGRGFEVVRADPRRDGKTWIALSRKESGSPELFSEMVGDVVGAMDASVGEGEAAVQRTMLRRVRMWQQFMSRGATPLSPEAELGLVGELTIMAILMDSGVSTEEVLRGWVGPDDALQDFLLGDGALEVKATMSSSGFPVKITSLEQLDDSVASPLFLAAVRFACEEGGLTLPEMIGEVEKRLGEEPGAVNYLRDKLIVAGYAETQSRHYTRRFESKEIRILSVSEGFPRLTPGTVPVGVTRALYEINLDHVGDYLMDLDTALNLLGVNG